MEVYRGIEAFQKRERAVVTTGTFDGVHIGHRIILDRLKQLANKVNGESVLLTFYPHPRMVLQPESDLALINTIEEKTQLLENAGIEHLIIQPFTKEFSRTTSLEFVRDILVNQIGTHRLVIGYDHHFGRNREGSFEHLQEFGPLYGFEVEEIPPQDIDNVNVSSTKIRTALSSGDLATANNYLGYTFFLRGKVIKGLQLGRKLGYPTANIDIGNPFKIIPANGIYAVEVKALGKEFQGMMNIGTRPTVEAGEGKLTLEVHLFDFDDNLYGQEIEIAFISKIREEKKFDNLEDLKIEMDKDKVRCLAALR